MALLCYYNYSDIMYRNIIAYYRIIVLVYGINYSDISKYYGVLSNYRIRHIELIIAICRNIIAFYRIVSIAIYLNNYSDISNYYSDISKYYCALSNYCYSHISKWNSDTSAPLPPRHLVTSAPSHLGPTTTSAPVWKKSLVRSAPSHLGP